MDDEKLIPLSYLAQFYYCNRRVALLMLEQYWSENIYTVEGNILHKNVHNQRIEKRSDILKLYEYNVVSHKHKIWGKCDCVELFKSNDGVSVPFDENKFLFYPVEYKHGVIRDEIEYNIQLCGQAICLEEMFNCNIEKGAVFYINSHRRVEVEFNDKLRKLTLSCVEDIFKIYNDKIIPKAYFTPKCKKCSVLDYCMPKVNQSSSFYMKNIVAEVCKKEVPNIEET